MGVSTVGALSAVAWIWVPLTGIMMQQRTDFSGESGDLGKKQPE